MANSFSHIYNGIQLVPQNTITPSSAGDLRYNSSNNTIELFDGTSVRSLTTNTGSSIISNKTIDDSNNITIKDSSLTIENSLDATKQIQFNVNLPSSGLVIYQTPDASTTLVGTNSTQVITNKNINGFQNTISNISLSADVTGILPLANGGTNANLTASIGQVAVSTASALNLTTGGTTGQYLQYNSGSNPTWVNAPGTGTVTSVTFTGDGTLLSNTPTSPVTVSGTLAASLNTQAANTVLAGPATGSAAAPTFRALVTADFPSSVPVGSVIDFAGGLAPTNYLICDGSPLLITSYPALYAIIGTTYGSSSGHFFLPNLGGRVTVGVGGSGGTTFNLADAGGTETVALTTAQLPSHSHTITDQTHVHSSSLNGNPGGGGYGNYVFASGAAVASAWSTTAAYTGINGTNATGSGSSHNNLQPYTALNKIIRYQ